MKDGEKCVQKRPTYQTHILHENVNFFGKENTRKLALKVFHQAHYYKLKKTLVKNCENVEW